MTKKIFENISWIVICRVLQSILTLIIGMITARYLGPSGFGVINYAASIVAFVIPIMQLGLSSTLVQEFILNPEREGEIVGTSLAMSFLASILSIIGVIAFVMVVNRGEQETIIVCFLYSLTLFFRIGELIQYWFQSKLLSKYPSITSLFAYIIVSIYKVYILISQKGILWFALTHVIEYAIISMILVTFYYKLSDKRIRISYSLAKDLFYKSKPYIGASLLVVVFQQTDRIMLNLFMGEAETGLYSAAIACIGMTGFLFSAIIDSARPVIFEAQKEDEQKYIERLRLLFCVVTYLSLFQSISMTILSKPIIYILYGKDYLEATSVLMVAVWFVTFGYYGVVRNIWILAENLQRYLWVINLQGAILNVAANYILIPYFGACGAAMASLLTQFFTNFVLCFMIKPLRPVGKIMIQSANPQILIGFIKNIYDGIKKNEQ